MIEIIEKNEPFTEIKVIPNREGDLSIKQFNADLRENGYLVVDSYNFEEMRTTILVFPPLNPLAVITGAKNDDFTIKYIGGENLI